MDKEASEMFNAVIEAIDRSEEKTNRRFDELEKKLVNMMSEKTQSLYEALHHEINACRLQLDSMELLNRQVKQHESRLAVLEKKVLKPNMVERMIP